MGEDTPGPSDYNPIKHKAYNGCMANSAIRSHSPQRMPTWNARIPGVGQYDPKLHGIGDPASQFSGNISALGREARYPGDQAQSNIGSETEPGVGPATFNPQVTNSGHRNTMRGAANEHKEVHGWSWHNVSDTVRNLFSFMLPEEVGTSHSMKG